MQLLCVYESGSQNATLVVVVVVVVVISSLKIPKAFLIGYTLILRSATKLCVHICADILHRSTVSDFPLIF